MERFKKLFYVALVLLGAGAIICGIGYVALGFDFHKLNTVEYVTNTYDVAEDFQNIKIAGENCDIRFIPSDDETCKVVSRTRKDDETSFTAQVEDRTLMIENKVIKENRGSGLSIFNFDMEEGQKMVVYLPKNEYSDLIINSNSGDIEIPEGFTFGSIDLKADSGDMNIMASTSEDITLDVDSGDVDIKNVSCRKLAVKTDSGDMNIMASTSEDITLDVDFGDVDIKNVSCRKLAVKNDSGSIKLTDTIAFEEFGLQAYYGDIVFDESDAENIYVKVDSGDVSGTLLSDKVFVTHCDEGDVNVPQINRGGKCEIDCSYGDINIKIK